jgi:hypothetical protein
MLERFSLWKITQPLKVSQCFIFQGADDPLYSSIHLLGLFGLDRGFHRSAALLVLNLGALGGGSIFTLNAHRDLFVLRNLLVCHGVPLMRQVEEDATGSPRHSRLRLWV